MLYIAHLACTAGGHLHVVIGSVCPCSRRWETVRHKGLNVCPQTGCHILRFLFPHLGLRGLFEASTRWNMTSLLRGDSPGKRHTKSERWGPTADWFIYSAAHFPSRVCRNSTWQTPQSQANCTKSPSSWLRKPGRPGPPFTAGGFLPAVLLFASLNIFHFHTKEEPLKRDPPAPIATHTYKNTQHSSQPFLFLLFEFCSRNCNTLVSKISRLVAYLEVLALGVWASFLCARPHAHIRIETRLLQLDRHIQGQ